MVEKFPKRVDNIEPLEVDHTSVLGENFLVKILCVAKVHSELLLTDWVFKQKVRSLFITFRMELYLLGSRMPTCSKYSKQSFGST